MELCKANGCPCLPYQKRLCRYHHDAADPKDWPFITEQLKKNVRVLRAIHWAMTDGRYRDNEYCRKTLARLSGEYPDLAPKDEETAMTWAYRALGWMSKNVRPVRDSEALRKLKAAKDKTKYEVRV